MRRIILVIMAAVSVARPLAAGAAGDKPLDVSQLPEAARQTVDTHFGDKTVALATVESTLADKIYDVVFTTGEKVEFDKKGNWTEVDCGTGAVPAYFIPAEIASYVEAKFRGQSIVKIEKESRGEYEVELSGGVELTFDKKFRLIDID